MFAAIAAMSIFGEQSITAHCRYQGFGTQSVDICYRLIWKGYSSIFSVGGNSIRHTAIMHCCPGTSVGKGSIDRRCRQRPDLCRSIAIIDYSLNICSARCCGHYRVYSISSPVKNLDMEQHSSCINLFANPASPR